MTDTTTTTDGRAPQTEQTVLWVGKTTSQCGGCGRNADPAELFHVMERMQGEGCGARFTHIAGQYADITDERLLEMRADLKLRGES